MHTYINAYIYIYMYVCVCVCVCVRVCLCDVLLIHPGTSGMSIRCYSGTFNDDDEVRPRDASGLRTCCEALSGDFQFGTAS